MEVMRASHPTASSMRNAPLAVRTNPVNVAPQPRVSPRSFARLRTYAPAEPERSRRARIRRRSRKLVRNAG